MKLNNKVFLLPDRLAHFREPVFIELAKELKKNNKNLYLFYDPTDYKVTNVPMPPSLENLNSYYKMGHLKNLYFGKTIRGGKVVIFQFGIIVRYLLHRPNVLIAWGEANRISTFILLILSRILKTKVILWTHGFYGNEKLWKKILRIIFYSLSDKLLIYGKHSFALTKKILPKKKIYLIGNSMAIDKTKFKFEDDKSYLKHKSWILRKYGIEKYSGNHIVLSFIGRLTKSKRIDLLIRLLSRPDANNLILWIIGSGDEYQTLLEYAKKLNLIRRIKFFGEIYDQSEIKSILSVSDIFICPSNLGLSVCSALSAGIPVITNEKMEMQMPESECLIDTQFAEFVDFEDEKILIDKINVLFNKFDSNFNLKYSIVDHYHKNFDPKKHALRIMDAISDNL